MTDEMVVSVSHVLLRIKTTLEQQLNLHDVWISGEVSNLTKHRSGHYYFSLKDERGAMSCVMFASYVKHLRFDLEEGMKVLVKASANVYPQRGSLQLYVTSMRPDGLGALFLELEQRKKRLEVQGYFDPAHKKTKPDVIEHIAIITAKEGAAIQDVITTVRKRWPMLKMTLYPALVQGQKAAETIVARLKQADAKGYDAILVVRGGGSFEDLFCFNDEELVKTIYHCQTYIVSGVGHEVDTTLCDLVADHRSVTPTAAAQWVTPDQKEVLARLEQMQATLNFQMHQHLQSAKKQLYTYQSNRYLSDPNTWIIDKRLRLDNLEQALSQTKEKITGFDSDIHHYQQSLQQAMGAKMRKEAQLCTTYFQQLMQAGKIYTQKQTQDLNHAKERTQDALKHYIENQQKHLIKNVSLLDAYSPLKVIERGYSITMEDGQVIHSIHQVQNGKVIQTQVKDGTILSMVTECQEESHANKKTEIS